MANLSCGPQHLVARSETRFFRESGSAVWPGAGPGKRDAGRRCSSSCPLPAHSVFGRAICGSLARPAVGRVSPCERHMDNSRMGVARKAVIVRMACHLHVDQLRASFFHGAGWPSGIGLPRTRSASVFEHAGRASIVEWGVNHGSGNDPLGRPPCRKEGHRHPSRSSLKIADPTALATLPCRRRTLGK